MVAPKATRSHLVPLKILIDSWKNKVLFAEAEKDFVDVLLSFLTLPLGTIARLLSKDSNIPSVKFGSLTSLYDSVSLLDQKHLWTDTCREMLLQPRNSMGPYCQKLKLNIDDTEPMKFFICDSWNSIRKKNGSLFSTFKNQKCLCGKPMTRVLPPANVTLEDGFKVGTKGIDIIEETVEISNKEDNKKERFIVTSPKRLGRNGEMNVPLEIVDPKSSFGGFARGPSMYMVTDDLVVSPISSISGVSHFKRVPFVDLEKRVIKVGLKEGLSLLKASLTSTSALTNGLDIFTGTTKRTKVEI
ncbi:hypothetical protein RJT34_17518 [Clitoria ternatea]|uniref:DUF674 domain-containing protein n=1 Tax=Clitoria ternatea TaxID=43366 RepID=A0AAN9JAE1_CLITE